MRSTNVLEELDRLPQEAQRQVFDFIAFLRTRYFVNEKRGTGAMTRLSEEEFVGMWGERADMMDSSLWVREAREREWGASE